MKVYSIRRTQELPVALEEAWQFFSSPENLARITPREMGFDITGITGDSGEMYPGQIIQYKIGIVPVLKTRWVTEITHVQKPHYFVDEQRFGPYAMWHHEHRFEPNDKGVLMTDEVHYAIPFGFIGRLANTVFVRKKVNAIFDYRYVVLEKLFNSQTN